MPMTLTRHLLLSSAVALVVTTGNAAADELSALKAQLEALQDQVDALEAQPRAPTPPDGASWLTFKRGSDIGITENAPDNAAFVKRTDDIPDNRGWTIAITPAADLPAPVHEITVSGYVKGDVIYDFDQDLGDLFLFTDLNDNRQDNEHVRLHARQSRFRIRSRSKTAIGEIRTLIEGDFFGGSSSRPEFRMRHAYGEWDMTPNLTLGVGQTWSNFMPLFDLADTVDFNGPILVFARQGQVRLTYHRGPLSVAVAVEDPSTNVEVFDGLDDDGDPVFRGLNDTTEQIPDFTGHVQYEMPGGSLLGLTGVVGQLRLDPDAADGDPDTTSSDNELLWGLVGAASVNLADWATLTASGGGGEGSARYIIGTDVVANVSGSAADPSIEGRRYWYVQANANVPLAEAFSANAVYSRLEFSDSDTLPGQTDRLQTVHLNLMWQPVSELKMGIEGMWAERKIEGGTIDGEDVDGSKPDAFRAMFGTWFFF